LIPKGSLFLGEASAQKSLDRINISFNRMVLPSGEEVRIRAMALSGDGTGGIQGKVNKHRDKAVFKALAETALSGLGLFTGGIRREAVSMTDTLRMNASSSLLEMAKKDLDSVKTDSSITVEAFKTFQILFLERV